MITGSTQSTGNAGAMCRNVMEEHQECRLTAAAFSTVSQQQDRAAHGALLPSSGHPVGGRQPQLRAAIRSAPASRTAASSRLGPCSRSLLVPASCSPALWTLISLWNETQSYGVRQGPPGWSWLPGKRDREVRWGFVHAGEEGRTGFLYYAGTIFYLFADKNDVSLY